MQGILRAHHHHLSVPDIIGQLAKPYSIDAPDYDKTMIEIWYLDRKHRIYRKYGNGQNPYG